MRTGFLVSQQTANSKWVTCYSCKQLTCHPKKQVTCYSSEQIIYNPSEQSDTQRTGKLLPMWTGKLLKMRTGNLITSTDRQPAISKLTGTFYPSWQVNRYPIGQVPSSSGGHRFKKCNADYNVCRTTNRKRNDVSNTNDDGKKHRF